MTPFVLPVTVRTADGDIDLLIDLPGPTPLSGVLPELIRRAGLPTGTVLNLGIGPVEDSWTLGRAPLLAGCILWTRPQDNVSELGPVNLSCVAGPDAGRWIALDGRPVVIGRDPGCDLTLDDPELSRRHARIIGSDDGFHITDLDSANGVRIEGQSRRGPGPDDPVPAGALIRLGGSIVRAGLDTEPSLLLTADGAGHLAVARPARVAPAFVHPLPAPIGPEPERLRRPLPLLAAVIGALAGAAIAIITGMWTFLLLAALGPVMMLATGLSDRAERPARSHRRNTADHRQALAEEGARLAAAVAADRADAWDRYPDPAKLARRALASSTRLWERRLPDPDFCRLTIGVGLRPARVHLEEPPVVTEVPITIDLTKIGVLGLAGECRPLLRHLIGQLATLHSPVDLHLSVFSEHRDLARSRDLPHVAIDGGIGQLSTGRAAAEVGRRCGPPLLGTAGSVSSCWTTRTGGAGLRG